MRGLLLKSPFLFAYIKKKLYICAQIHFLVLMAKAKINKGSETRTYISLFSSAGVGCYGFKLAGFECVATVELLARRLKIQKYNQKCKYPSGYIGGDMTTDATKALIFDEIKLWEKHHSISEIDVVVATPPCQGMSVANHKKGDELKRNSLVVESLKMVSQIKPKFFVFENVRSFLTSICTDVDGENKPIKEAIESNLGGEYNIYGKVFNFKDYGNPSSRPRTLVIGVRKDLKEISPFSIIPNRQTPKTLRELIGHLPALNTMGEIWENDLYHSFRSYNPIMRPWITPLQEGQSAFDNPTIETRPHQIVDGKIVPNVQKNGDKYTRQYWDKPAPCIHTRNDILASQNTVHPTDDRVFSIRELMLLMSIPDTFQWSEIPYSELNTMPLKDKQAFLKKEDVNIRQNIGEAVPTIIFQQIAQNINKVLSYKFLTDAEIAGVIKTEKLTDANYLLEFIKNNHSLGFVTLSKIAELANAQREDNAAYYTGQDICFNVVKHLPDFSDSETITILEPAVGLGNFLPSLFIKYANVAQVVIDVYDIDSNSINLLQELLKTLTIPKNFKIRFITGDTLKHNFNKTYTIVVGNPPYKKVNTNGGLKSYKLNAANQDTNNLFAFFIEMAIKVGKYVALIVPKSLINAPEFNITRQIMNKHSIISITDYGETAFKKVKIETISFVLGVKKKPSNTIVESYITNTTTLQKQEYITDGTYPYWLIYRNEEFDKVAANLTFGVFSAFRDREITKVHTKGKGKVRVLKSRNIGSNSIVNIDGYDCYVDDANSFVVGKYLNTDCILVPNLTYYPRACKMPINCIADGSVAILTLRNSEQVVTEEDLAYYSSDEFTTFYKIARNRGTRSLNIDNNSVFFFGVKIKK
jgi:DNA (cytosine-5)-methyltransferase 1